MLKVDNIVLLWRLSKIILKQLKKGTIGRPNPLVVELSYELYVG